MQPPPAATAAQAPVAHGLTQAQYLTLCAIQELSQGPVAPSFRQLMRELDMASVSNMHWLVRKLEERGYVARLPGRPRSLVVLKPVPLPEDVELCLGEEPPDDDALAMLDNARQGRFPAVWRRPVRSPSGPRESAARRQRALEEHCLEAVAAHWRRTGKGITAHAVGYAIGYQNLAPLKHAMLRLAETGILEAEAVLGRDGRESGVVLFTPAAKTPTHARQRRCLMGDHEFFSAGPHERICPACKRSAEYRGGGL